jgi:leader peptidase (prepilin peptidase)/N-methyltransferase
MIAYGVIWHYLGYSVNMIIGCTLFSSLLVISIIDIKYYIIPNGLIMFLLILGIIYSIITKQLLYGFWGFIIGSIPLILLYVIANNKIGGGDIKLLAVAGWFIGWKNVLLSLFIASFIGSIISIILILIKLHSRKDKIPFAPYLSLGIIIAFFYGEKLIIWYYNLFL